MSNATALRLADVEARLMAAPHNATVELADIVAPDVLEFARMSKMGYKKVSDKTIERLLAEAAANITPEVVEPQLMSWTAYMGNNYGETWDSVICYGHDADEAAADAVVRTGKLNGGGWSVHRIEGPHKVAEMNISEPARVEADDEIVELTELIETRPTLVPELVAKAPEGDAKRSNFKHDACTHERTPKARAACRKARAKAAARA